RRLEEERMRSRTTPGPLRPRPTRRTLLAGIPLLGAGAVAMSGCTPDDAGAATDVENILTISLNQTESHPSYLALTFFGEQLAGWRARARHVYTDRGPIEGPDDLAGLKIRVQESDVFMELTRALGGSPTPMAYGEVYTALQAGVLNGAENNEVSYVTQRHYEI